MVRLMCSWGKDLYGNLKKPADSRLYFHLLEPELKRPYLRLIDACYKRQELVDLEGVDSDSAMKVVDCVRWDNPSLISLPSFLLNTDGYSTRINIQYQLNEYITGKLQEKMDSVLGYIRNRTDGMDRFQKELFVHDYLASSVTYSKDTMFRYSAADAIVNRTGVCSGISAANCYLLNSLGVDCAMVRGKVHGSTVGHAWNIVNLDGYNYHEDVTFDLECSHNCLVHNFMNVDDERIKRNRSVDLDIECTGREYNYFRRNSRIASDSGELGSIIRDQLSSGRIEFSLDPDFSREFNEQNVTSLVMEQLTTSNNRSYRTVSTYHSENSDEYYIYLN